MTKIQKLVIDFDTVLLMLDWQSFYFKGTSSSADASCDALPGVSAEWKAL